MQYDEASQVTPSPKGGKEQTEFVASAGDVLSKPMLLGSQGRIAAAPSAVLGERRHARRKCGVR